MSTCINCKSDVSTAFCSNCGQPNPPKKLTFGYLWYDFQSRIYGFDGMFPRTLRDLTIQPGVAAREHIAGNRVKHYGPVGYFFLMITVFLLILSMIDVNLMEFMSSATKEIADTSQNQSGQLAQQKLMGFVYDNMRTFSFLIIIPITLTAWLFFRKAGYNILEHSVLPFYVFGHTYWLTILSLLFFYFFETSPRLTIQLVISILFFAFACSNFYNHNSKVKAFFKGIAVYLIGYFLFVVMMIVFTVIYVFTNPEFMEMIRPKK